MFLHLRYFPFWTTAFYLTFNRSIISSLSNTKLWILFVLRCYKLLLADPDNCMKVGLGVDALCFAKEVFVKRKKTKLSPKGNFFFTVGVMFKNERGVMKEWLDHYLFHGVDHVFMINDGSDDDFQEVLRPYIDSSFVTLFDSTSFPRFSGRQFLIYDLFLLSKQSEVEWMALLDMDEFLYSPNDIDLKNVIKFYSDFSQIIVSWLVFSSNDLLEQPFSVVSGFTKRASPEKFDYVSCRKSIVKMKFLKRFAIHRHVASGNVVNVSFGDGQASSSLLINHYYVQSKEYWEKKKVPGGSANQFSKFKKRSLDLFNKFNVSDVEDLRLYEQNKEIIEKLKSQK